MVRLNYAAIAVLIVVIIIYVVLFLKVNVRRLASRCTQKQRGRVVGHVESGRAEYLVVESPNGAPVRVKHEKRLGQSDHAPAKVGAIIDYWVNPKDPADASTGEGSGWGW